MKSTRNNPNDHANGSLSLGGPTKRRKSMTTTTHNPDMIEITDFWLPAETTEKKADGEIMSFIAGATFSGTRLNNKEWEMIHKVHWIWVKAVIEFFAGEDKTFRQITIGPVTNISERASHFITRAQIQFFVRRKSGDRITTQTIEKFWRSIFARISRRNETSQIMWGKGMA